MPRLVDTGPLETNGTSAWLAEGAVFFGPFSIQGEYIRSTVHDASIPLGGPDLGNASFDDYYVYASYLFTCETRPYDRKTGAFGRVLPIENARSGQGRACLLQGAWEIGVR